MEAEDVFILQKILAVEGFNWKVEDLSRELDVESAKIEECLFNLKEAKLISVNNQIQKKKVEKFLLTDLPRLHPASPGKLTRGTLTGAKPGTYFCVGLPYTSIWVWPHEDGSDIGYELKPLSPKCCFAVLQDERLKKILAITETLRVSGDKALDWAQKSFRQIGLF